MPVNQKKISRILHSVGLLNNLTDREVAEIYESQFEFIYNTIRAQQIENASDEELQDMKLSFILKYIGKIYTDVNIINKMHNRKSYLNKLKEDGRKSTSSNDGEGE